MTTETADDALTKRFRAAAREPDLIIQLDRSLFGGQPLLRLMKPGATARSKSIELVPVIVGGSDGQETHSAMLRMLADLLEEEGR